MNNVFSLLSKKNILILFVGFVLFLVIIVFIFPKNSNLPPQTTIYPTPTFYEPPISPVLLNEYSNFNKLVPGKNTPDDLMRTSGNPSRTESANGKAYYFYKTPLEGFENTAVFQNGILKYATENIFGASYRGRPVDFLNSFGKPELVLFDKNDEVLEWRVYPTKGVALGITPFENVIIEITYFSPQTKEDFLKNLMNDLELEQEQEIDYEETTAPGL